MPGHQATVAWIDPSPHIPGWALAQRLSFIELRLFWEGRMNRSALQKAFRISPQQASKDLQLYQQVTRRTEPDGSEVSNTVYDRKVKAYVRLEPFEPRFERPEAHQHLSGMLGTNSLQGMNPDRSEATIRGIIFVTPPDLPRARQMDPKIVREILAAAAGRHDLEIGYSSPVEPEESYFRITPVSFGFDGFRWHVRAFRHDRRLFRDISLDRIREIGRKSPTITNELPFDTLWEETIEVILVPNPGLDEDGRKHIQEQYGMKDGSARVSIRRAFIPYFLKRYQLEEEATGMAPHQRPLAIGNRAELDEAMPPHMRVPPDKS